VENKVYINSLLDFYEGLLTEKQRRVMDSYYREDNSISEIAEDEMVSRSAVHDLLKRCRKELESYEEVLGLVQNFESRMRLYDKIKEVSNSDEVNALIDQCIAVEEN